MYITEAFGLCVERICSVDLQNTLESETDEAIYILLI